MPNFDPLHLSLFLTILFFCWGACIGSFLNVCIYRIPLELSIVSPRSHCPDCKKPIPWYLNIPLLSYLCLGGKCKYCGSKIPARYFIVEAITALLFLMIWLKFDFAHGTRPMGLFLITDWKLVPVYWLFVSSLILGTFVDFEHMIIPDRVTLGGIAAGLVLSALVPQMHGQESMLRGLMFSAIGAALGWSILWTISVVGTFIFKKEAMGFGDVKLIGAIGAYLGWQAVLFTIFISAVVGSIIGITLVLSQKKEMQSRIPYGPYLALAAILWVFWGPTWMQAYLNLLRPVY